MRESMHRKMILKLALWIWIVLLSAFVASPAPAEETGPVKEYKGLFQVDVKASGVNRGIVENLGAGVRGEYSVDSARFFVKASIKPLSPLELYVLGGVANLRITNVFPNAFYGSLGPYYGGGFRLTLYESPDRRNLSLFLDGSIAQITSKERNASKTVDGTAYQVDEEILWREYNVIFGGRGRFPFAGSPEGYAGLMVSRVEGTDTLSSPISQKYNLEELGLLSVILGVDFYLDSKENAAINAELGLGDPLYITGGFKFWF